MRELTIEDVRRADLIARKRFEYLFDPGPDTWRSFADQALAGQKWVGDCDDLASTALDILVREHGDWIMEDCFRLCVASPQCPPGTPYDHMIGAVRVGSELWIVGDTFGHAYPNKRSPHRIVRYSKLSDGVRWMEGTNPK